MKFEEEEASQSRSDASRREGDGRRTNLSDEDGLNHFPRLDVLPGDVTSVASSSDPGLESSSVGPLRKTNRRSQRPRKNDAKGTEKRELRRQLPRSLPLPSDYDLLLDDVGYSRLFDLDISDNDVRDCRVGSSLPKGSDGESMGSSTVGVPEKQIICSRNDGYAVITSVDDRVLDESVLQEEEASFSLREARLSLLDGSARLLPELSTTHLTLDVETISVERIGGRVVADSVDEGAEDGEKEEEVRQLGETGSRERERVMRGGERRTCSGSCSFQEERYSRRSVCGS